MRWEDWWQSEGVLEVMREVLPGGGRDGAMRTDAFDRASKGRADKQAMRRSLVTVTEAVGG